MEDFKVASIVDKVVILNVLVVVLLTETFVGEEFIDRVVCKIVVGIDVIVVADDDWALIVEFDVADTVVRGMVVLDNLVVAEYVVEGNIVFEAVLVVGDIVDVSLVVVSNFVVA